MKRVAAAISAALVLALAAPAFAAVEIGGKFENEFKLHENEVTGRWQIDGETGIDVETRLTGANGSTIKGVVELGFETGFHDKGKKKGKLDGTRLFDDLLDTYSLANLRVEKAWVESTGAYWHGGPDVTTKVGDVGATWDPIVAEFDKRRGIALEGVTIGPATARAFYMWDGADRPYGLMASGSVDGVELHGTVVRKGTENNFLAGARTSLIPGVSVSGKVALDGQNRRLYRVEAAADDLVPGVKVRAAYRGADDDFAPMYTIAPEDEYGDPVGRNDAENIHYDLLDGFSVAAETVQKGVRLMAAYDQPHEMLKLGASTDLYGFTVGYSAKVRQGAETEHKLRASTTVNAIRELQGLGLSGEVKLVGDKLTWSTKAKYAAPNGIELGAEYDSEEGPSATAAVKVRF